MQAEDRLRTERVEYALLQHQRGAALLAGVALRAIGWADVPALVPVDRTFIPDPQAERVYARLAAELPKAYSGLKGVFARLHG